MKSELFTESQKCQDATDQIESMKRDYEQTIMEQEGKLSAMIEKLKKLEVANDEKDLEISRLRRESEETAKQNKGNNEKIVRYQSANEKLRKDKTVIEEKYKELKKQLEMQKLLGAGKAMDSDDSSDSEGQRKRKKKGATNDLAAMEDKPVPKEEVKPSGGLDIPEEVKPVAKQSDLNELREFEEMEDNGFNAGNQGFGNTYTTP